MSKNSLEYAELAGLRIALGTAMFDSLANKIVIEWLSNRIKELEKK